MSFSLHFTAKALPFAGDGLDLVNLAALSFSSRAMCRLVAVETFSAGQVTDAHVADNSSASVSSYQNTTTAFQLKSRIQTRESQTNLKHIFARRPGGTPADIIAVRKFAVSLLAHSRPIVIPNLTFSSIRGRQPSSANIVEMLLSSSVPNYFVTQLSFACGLPFLFSGPFPERIAESYPNLRILNLSQCDGLSDITAIVKHCPNLFELSLGHTGMNFEVPDDDEGEDSALSSTVPLQHLRYLALDDFTPDSSLLGTNNQQHPPSWDSSCDSSYNPSVKMAKWLKSVCSTKSLRYLDLHRSCLASLDWSGLEAFENLNQVDLTFNKMFAENNNSESNINSNNNILVALSRCPKLMFLDLSYSCIELVNRWLKELEYFLLNSIDNNQGFFVQLKRLDMNDMRGQLDDDGVANLFFRTLANGLVTLPSSSRTHQMKLASLTLSNHHMIHSVAEERTTLLFFTSFCKGSLKHFDLTNCAMPGEILSPILEEVSDTLESLSLNGWWDPQGGLDRANRHGVTLDALVRDILPQMDELISLDLRIQDQSGGTVNLRAAAAAAQNQPDPDDLDCFKILAERAPRLHHLWIRTAGMKYNFKLTHLHDFELLSTLYYDHTGILRQEGMVNALTAANAFADGRVGPSTVGLFSTALAELAADGVRLVEY